MSQDVTCVHAMPDRLFRGMPAIWAGGQYVIWNGLRNCTYTAQNLDVAGLETGIPDIHSSTRKIYSDSQRRNWLNVVLVLTNRCNLSCRYCYAQPNKYMNEEMTPRRVESVLEWCLGQASVGRLYVSFVGGEPTLKPECIEAAVNLMRDSGHPHSFHITTNGTCEIEFLDWLIDQHFDFSVSSDGLPADHDVQRPFSDLARSSPHVERFMLYLAKRGALFQVRATVTKHNVGRLPQALEYWASLGVEFVHFELVGNLGMARNHSHLPDLETYVTLFPKMLDTAQRLGIYLVNSAFMKLLTPSHSFCTSTQGGRLHFNSDGSISGCYKIQRAQGAPDGFILGQASQTGLNVDEQARSRLRRFGASYHHECGSCFARNVCGGGCPLDQVLYGYSGQTDRKLCNVKRSLLREAILHIHECSRRGTPSIVFGSSVYDVRVEAKFEQPESKEVDSHEFGETGTECGENGRIAAAQG